MEYNPVNYVSQTWRPGFFRRLPWTGLVCIIGAILGIAASIGILKVSDGQPITSWRFAPTVYLSISYTVTNILLGVALSEGVTISWWTKALGEKTELGDLHRYWSFGTKFRSAVKSGRRFNFIAFACILVAITPINGPLLQRSSSVTRVTMMTQPNLQVQAATTIEIPTGIASGRGMDISLITNEFAPVVEAFYSGSSIQANDTGCSGTGICTGYLQAAGLASNCTESLIPFDSQLGTDPNNYNWNGSDIFSTDFQWSVKETSGWMTLNVTYKDQPPANGTLSSRLCTLKVGTVQYPILIDGNKSTISLQPNTSLADDVVNAVGDYNGWLETNFFSGPTLLGGLYLALHSRYSSTANLRFTGAHGYTLLSSGATAAQYADISHIAAADGDYESKMWTVVYRDPTADLLQAARELLFRTAVQFGNATTVQNVVGASEEKGVNVYVSHYAYLGAAVGITGVAIGVVLGTFAGFGKLGRRVTLSPLETARAFNAPLFWGTEEADAEGLVRAVGRVPVRYGFVSEEGRGENGSKQRFRFGVEEVEGGGSGMRLEIVERERVVG